MLTLLYHLEAPRDEQVPEPTIPTRLETLAYDWRQMDLWKGVLAASEIKYDLEIGRETRLS